MPETKLEKFQRLFPQRASRVLKAVQVLNNLNSSNYEQDPQMVSQFQTELLEELGLSTPKKEVPETETKDVDWAYAAWAMECLQRGQHSDALEHLKTALRMRSNLS